MTDYRNILRLHSQGHSQRELERELHCSRHTISAVLVQSAAAGITWPLEDGVTNEDIQEILFPGKYAYASPYTVPDFRYIHEELAKKGLRKGSFEHAGHHYTLDRDGVYDILTDVKKYNTTDAATYRRKAKEQKALKDKSSALTKEMKAITDSFIAMHPDWTPDDTKVTIKCID